MNEIASDVIRIITTYKNAAKTMKGDVSAEQVAIDEIEDTATGEHHLCSQLSNYCDMTTNKIIISNVLQRDAFPNKFHTPKIIYYSMYFNRR